MAMSGAPTRPREAGRRAVVWHDLECGAYSADMSLWLSLAAGAGAPGQPARVLDIGAGTGRVTIALARAGHPVSAVDIDPALLEELRERTAGLPVSATTADARTFELERRDHDLGLVPMQTLQLLRGRGERAAVFQRARAHLRPGALLACAIVTEVESFDSRNGSLGPSPERTCIEGELYVSRAIRVHSGERMITIERERFLDPGPDSPTPPLAPELDVIELERITEAQLHEEARALGLRPEPGVRIDETEDHTGSEVVVFRV
jgi:SAM-dependent methyltransferase